MSEIVSLDLMTVISFTWPKKVQLKLEVLEPEDYLQFRALNLNKLRAVSRLIVASKDFMKIYLKDATLTIKSSESRTKEIREGADSGGDGFGVKMTRGAEDVLGLPTPTRYSDHGLPNTSGHPSDLAEYPLTHYRRRLQHFRIFLSYNELESEIR
ncbi:unnamed protein product [Nezara viridula]|uniref:Uncharacterized protein n=1 Tax=Nezara viridula TaxID=85310 RepID=A0A9P0MK81_NEZVI|nr:unnamed protein product [Nezara viridula]